MFRGNLLQLTKQNGLWKALCLSCYPIVRFFFHKEKNFPFREDGLEIFSVSHQ